MGVIELRARREFAGDAEFEYNRNPTDITVTAKYDRRRKGKVSTGKKGRVRSAGANRL